MLPTRQDVAIVICGGGDPFAEAERAIDLCEVASKPYEIFVGNDMIGLWPGHVHHALTLHPDKLTMWTGKRMTSHFSPPDHTWAHRPFSGISDWTRDWAGSTGLFAVKVARSLGFVHVILCGVHMSEDSGHFVRKQRWDACSSFLRGWEIRRAALEPYVRSFGGWTRAQYGLPDPEWLMREIEDRHREQAPETYVTRMNGGLTA